MELVATPAEGSAFLGWAGACEGPVRARSSCTEGFSGAATIGGLQLRAGWGCAVMSSTQSSAGSAITSAESTLTGTWGFMRATVAEALAPWRGGEDDTPSPSGGRGSFVRTFSRMFFSAHCLSDERAFWIHAVFYFAVAVSIGAVVLALQRSPLAKWFAVGGILLGVGVVGMGEAVEDEALPSGGGVSPETQRYYREQAIQRDGKEAFERNLREYLAADRSECRGACIRLAAIPVVITIAALGILRARKRAASAA